MHSEGYLSVIPCSSNDVKAHELLMINFKKYCEQL